MTSPMGNGSKHPMVRTTFFQQAQQISVNNSASNNIFIDIN